MKFTKIILLVFIALIFSSCSKEKTNSDTKALFLHHSTGDIIWNGKQPSMIGKIVNNLSPKLYKKINKTGLVPSLLKEYNTKNGKNYSFEEIIFPKESPYGWSNFPYDYYNIWVKNAGNNDYMSEPTLEILTKQYQVIIFKHCFPVCYIRPDTNDPNVDSNVKTMANYKLQYNALKDKLLEFPNTKFILFTGATQVEANIDEETAKLAKDFFDWVRTQWDTPEDNIYLWDLYSLQTEGGLYFKDEYAQAPNNPHPNSTFANKAGKLLFDRIIDIIENSGVKTTLTGSSKV